MTIGLLAQDPEGRRDTKKPARGRLRLLRAWLAGGADQ
jgi:hypothetical protein